VCAYHSWHQLTDFSPLLLGVAASGANLYVVGGRSGCSGLSLCECYNTTTKTWRPIADLNIGRSQVAVCALEDGRIVAAGGCNAWNCTNSVEIYDPTENKWNLLEPPLDAARRGASVALFKSNCLVISINKFSSSHNRVICLHMEN